MTVDKGDEDGEYEFLLLVVPFHKISIDGKGKKVQEEMSDVTVE